jgi:hypothetical protein
MKHIILTGLIALSTVAAYADNVPVTPVEGHQYKVVDGQLVDVSPTPVPTPTPVTVIINNNNSVTTTTQQPTAPTVAVPTVTVPAGTILIPQTPTFRYTETDSNFILSVEAALSNHDWRTLSNYLADGHVNYFGHRYATVSYIANDMQNDTRIYGRWHSTYYPETFTREVSNEYSPHWVGPMIYDSINVYSVVEERGVRVHRAMVRLTVGYTYVNGDAIIYALVLKVLS